MKPYDVKELALRLKELGLAEAESVAKKVVETVFAWVEESAKKSPSAYDDLLLGIVALVKSEILAQIDKISPNV